MKKLKYQLLTFFSKKTIVTTPLSPASGTTSIYSLKLRSIDGHDIELAVYKGKKILIVNTASACGYTPQYNALQELHAAYKNKLIVLGFPSNDFGGQEPANNEEIGLFCTKNFGVTFPLFEKSNVIGPAQNPLYKWLTDKDQNGWNQQAPDWNFCKYLVNEEGALVKFYSSAIDPLGDEITKQL